MRVFSYIKRRLYVVKKIHTYSPYMGKSPLLIYKDVSIHAP
ncbi:hypothetical protein HMPREF3201_00444 [Megasphaera sp. MJR8396C]|nr:hypothetical protein HMPREF3201_00444 [Megasphaera sp. MJR8396C]